MAPRTIDDVQDAVDAAFSWRRIEMRTLISAMLSATRASADSPLARALTRSCVTIVYAHWEGFVKETCQCYVNYLAKQKLRFNQLNDRLLRTALLAAAKRLADGDQGGAKTLLMAVRSPEDTRAYLPKNSIVDTKSNLRYSVLCNILESAGFPAELFATKAHLIDRSLCDLRNTVAHGRESFPDPHQIEASMPRSSR